MWLKLFLLAIALNIASTLANPIAESDSLPPPIEESLDRARGFQHPGVLVSKAQLDFIAGKVKSGAQPWANAYTDMTNNPLASLSRQPKPTATVECGPTSTPNLGCTGAVRLQPVSLFGLTDVPDERQDALAAYAMSLAWYTTKSSQYAEKASQCLPITL